MPQAAYAPLPPVNDGGTALDYATGGYRPPPASTPLLATPSLVTAFATPLDRAASAPPAASVPVAAPPSSAPPAGAPVPAAGPGAAPQTPPAVAAILAQPDPSFDTFWARMLPRESGGRDVPNYRYDPTHTASGAAQITDTNWRAIAPRLGIDVRRYPTAMSAPLPYQKAVAKLMHRMYGQAPWDKAHGGSLPTGNPAADHVFDVGRQAGEDYHRTLQGDIAAANEAIREYHRLAIAAPPGSAEQDKLLQQQFDASARAADALDKLAKTPPVFTPQTVLQRFGSLATLVGIFGGLMSKQPITAALNAAGTAMKAANQQDWDQYHAAFNTWRAQTDMAVAAIRAHSDAINEILANKRLGFDEQQAQLHALYAQFQMPLALDALKKGDIEMQYRIATQLPMLASELQKNQAAIAMIGEQIPLLHAKATLTQEQAALMGAEAGMYGSLSGGEAAPSGVIPPGAPSSSPPPGAAGGTPGTPSGGAQKGDPPAPEGISLPAWTDALVWARTGKMPSVGSFGNAMTGAYKMAVEFAKPYALKALGLTAAQATRQWQKYEAQGAAERSWLSGPRADTVRSFGVALDHAEVLNSVISALGTGSVQALNRAKLAFEREFGYPAPTEFDGIKLLVADEINKAVVGGRVAEGDRDKMQQVLQAAQSPTAIRGVIEKLERLMAGQLAGLRRQYEGTTGQSGADLDPLLSPEARSLLDKYKGVEAEGVPGPPAVGSVESGYRFKGGDPGNPANWVKVQ